MPLLSRKPASIPSPTFPPEVGGCGDSLSSTQGPLGESHPNPTVMAVSFGPFCPLLGSPKRRPGYTRNQRLVATIPAVLMLLSGRPF